MNCFSFSTERRSTETIPRELLETTKIETDTRALNDPNNSLCLAKLSFNPSLLQTTITNSLRVALQLEGNHAGYCIILEVGNKQLVINR